LIKVIVSLICASWCFATPSLLHANTGLVLSPEEVRKTIAHGPWPLPKEFDAGNDLSRRPAAIRFGQRLFFDTRFSVNKSVSCATCHDPNKAFTDGLPVSKSLLPTMPLSRNSPSLLNAAHERWHGWDGASDSIWSQSIRPLLDEREMGLTPEKLKAIVVQEKDIRRTYSQVFTSPIKSTSESVVVNIAKAIGAYVATLVSARTTFDMFRDSLAKGDLAKAALYPIEAQRGLKIFIGKGQCSTCHVGPMFSNGEFADTGVPFFIRPGLVDEGRHGGIIALKQSPYNLLGSFSNANVEVQKKTRHVDPQHRNFGEFKVPSLRNVGLTAPYMHNGSIATLEAAIDHYSNMNMERLHADGDQILKPLKLTDQEKSDLLRFLKTL
jgi:cytochrome c peroxidase